MFIFVLKKYVSKRKRGKTVPFCIVCSPSFNLRTMNVIQAGFEPTTHALEGRCSIQLSY